MAALVVLDPGPLATVQDLGRPGHGALGVAVSGAADALSLRVANRLAGNPDGAAAVEVTLRGGAWRFEDDTTFVLSGAEMPALLEGARERRTEVPRWTAVSARAGSVLRIGAAAWGVRAYLAVRGGLDVPEVLGSRATHVASGLGGFGGRALRAGDRLTRLPHEQAGSDRALDDDAVDALEDRLRAPSVRATDGSHAARFEPASARAFWGTPYAATDQADRMGVRLAGARIAPPGGGTLPTEPMAPGAVQVPGTGQPLVLLADGPTTGGYPVLAWVAAADQPRLGQLQPRERIAFRRIPLEEARAAYAERERWLDALVPCP
jgi:biotin-dependent carboxylase-like uncharacterized protein